jgi:hypothetical protein
VDASPSVDDDELTRQALEADPDLVHVDALPFESLLSASGEGILPGWYMPIVRSRRGQIRGWRRGAIVLLVASFLAIDAYGLCNTYGDLLPRTVYARTHGAR